MRTLVVAVAGLPAALLALTLSGCSDDTSEPSPALGGDVACDRVITDDVLTTLGWTGYATAAEESAGRCEWAGDAGTITAGGRVGSLDSECDRLSAEQGYEASTSWLAAEDVADGCVVVNEEGLGVYEVVAQQGDDLVQVRVALLEARPVDDVRTALVKLVTAA